MSFVSPQDVEDAFYDAIDENDYEAMMKTWEESAHSVCLLPMQPARLGTDEISATWQGMMRSGTQVEISVSHIMWNQLGDVAIHMVEETITLVQGRRSQPPIYATNVYRKGEEGWRMLMHINSPVPLPPEAMAGGPMASGLSM